jgi:hypothetical protein
MTLTPVASRPCEEISRTDIRIVTPPDDTATISSSRSRWTRRSSRRPPSAFS